MKDPKAMKIIVADDNRHSLMYHGLLLKKLGHTIVPARSGLEVLKLLKVVEPDIVMLDIGMETIDGLTVLKHIMEDSQTSSIPVIMASGESSNETISQCMKLGCVDYLIKPVTVERLHAALEKCVLSVTPAKRRHARVPFNKKVVVTYQGRSYHLPVETLSEGGVFIRRKDPFPKGSIIEIMLPLDDETAVRLQGEVVHVENLFENPFPPGMGITFKGMTDEDIKRLRSFIELIATGDILDELKES